MSVSTQTIDLNDKELADRALDDAAAKAEQFVDITGIQADKLVAGGAHAAGYEPRSGLIPEWAQASVQSFGGWQLVTVPLSGTDLPELSKVTYFKMGDSAEVVEWAASLTADNTVSVDGWQNGQKFREALFVIEGANQDGGASITSVGLNQKKLERCLTANGMPQWIVTTIFSVCTAVCIFTLGVGCIVCISAWLAPTRRSSTTASSGRGRNVVAGGQQREVAVVIGDHSSHTSRCCTVQSHAVALSAA